jgi:hypothetical protein
MSTKKGLGRLYDRLSPEERFRLDVLALARGDEEESERLTATCPRRAYTMNDWGFVGRWEAARELAMLAYVDVVRRLDKIKMIGAFRSLFPYLSTNWQDDAHLAYFEGPRAGSRHAWNRSGKAGEPPGWEADEEEAERNADPTIDEDLQKWTGEGRFARLEGKLEGDGARVGAGGAHRLGGLRALLRTGDGARGREGSGGAREAVRRESVGPRGAERTPRGGGGRGGRGGIPDLHDGGMAARN